MIVYHACRLHEGVAYSGTHECKSSFSQIFAHRVGLGGSGWNFMRQTKGMLEGFAFGKLPDIPVKTAVMFLNLKEAGGILYGSEYLKAVANDTRII